jgi:hypothetical protein
VADLPGDLTSLFIILVTLDINNKNPLLSKDIKLVGMIGLYKDPGNAGHKGTGPQMFGVLAHIQQVNPIRLDQKRERMMIDNRGDRGFSLAG